MKVEHPRRLAHTTTTATTETRHYPSTRARQKLRLDMQRSTAPRLRIPGHTPAPLSPDAAASQAIWQALSSTSRRAFGPTDPATPSTRHKHTRPRTAGPQRRRQEQNYQQKGWPTTARGAASPFAQPQRLSATTSPAKHVRGKLSGLTATPAQHRRHHPHRHYLGARRGGFEDDEDAAATETPGRDATVTSVSTHVRVGLVHVL